MKPGGRLRSLGVAVLGALWVGLGLLVGWFVGYLADRLALPAHHARIYSALGLSAVVLCAWAYGTRLLYLEVRAGVEEATSDEPVRARTGYAWTAALAGPIVGLVLALSSHSAAHPAPGARAVTAPVVTAVAGTPGMQLDLSVGSAETGSADASERKPSGSADAGERKPADAGERRVAADADAGIASRAPEAALALLGLGVLGGGLLAAHLARLRRYQLMRSPVGGRPPALLGGDAVVEAELRPLRTLELPAWIDAANRLLCARLVANPSLEPPRVGVVRAGPHGVEILLDRPRADAPEGFVAADEGHCWRLDPRRSLAEVRSAAGDAQPYLAVLVPIGEDADGSYLVACGPGESLAVRGAASEMRLGLGAIWAHLASAPWAEVACYRVGPPGFPGSEQMVELTVEMVAGIDSAMQRSPLWRAGLPDSQPVVFAAEPGLAAEVRAAAPGIVAVVGTMLEADRILCYDEGCVTVEPLGLTIPALVPTEGELAAIERLVAAASALPTVPPERPAGLPPPDAELPAAGAVEVRLLRPVPDLVGEVDPSKLHPEVVQVVAYLALHGHRATTSKLRDVFGRYKREESHATRTVWNATSHTRNVLGSHRFPVAHGNKPYTLDDSVSCDWLRLREIAAVGRSLERAGEPVRAIETLRVALELIGDGYPCSDDAVAARYDWLDAEQLLVELETDVVRAAHAMATLSIEHCPYPHSLEDAAWAIERGRVISPEALPLREVALRLAAAREDAAALDAEFFAAVDAVDELALGREVDPRLEAVYRRLGRTLGGMARPGRERARAPLG